METSLPTGSMLIYQRVTFFFDGGRSVDQPFLGSVFLKHWDAFVDGYGFFMLFQKYVHW